MTGIIALDTETTGLDLHHGARPFLVTICKDQGQQIHWEWDVDPETRRVCVPDGDFEHVISEIAEAESVVLQNVKFDYRALCEMAKDLGLLQPLLDAWDWDKIEDTLVAGHLLYSNRKHGLDDMAVQYLKLDIGKYEKAMREATVKARAMVNSKSSKFHHWRIAKPGLPEMPSAKEKTWKIDTWLPRTFARTLNFPDDHPWQTLTSIYANADSAATFGIWNKQRGQLKYRSLWKIYRARMRLPHILATMESHGITVSLERLDELTAEYREESAACARKLVNIAKTYGYDLVLPRGANNDSLTDFCFGRVVRDENGKKTRKRVTTGTLALEVVERSEKTGEPSLDKYAMEKYDKSLPPNTKQKLFIDTLRDKRKRDTAISYLLGYKRFGLPLQEYRGDGVWVDVPGWIVLHPNLNQTGTATTRYSGQNPNEQNISKKEGFNLRYSFGPAPGREWYSFDGKNMELRVPAYESDEEAFIDLFEHPDKPPYFGSNHLLAAHVIHRKPPHGVSEVDFEEICRCDQTPGGLDGRKFKKRYDNTWYRWVKEGDFALQYGAVDKESGDGTADRAFRVPHAQSILAAKFTKQTELNKSWVKFAEKHGWIETLPDRSVDPERGYPILCTRTENGRIKPTVPFSYHIQGTVGWWMDRCMVRCDDQMVAWRAEDFDSWLIMMVHDELVFDFPAVEGGEETIKADLYMEAELRQRGVLTPGYLSVGDYKSNLGRARVIQQIMEKVGLDLVIPHPKHAWKANPRENHVPIKTSCEYHAVSYDKSFSVPDLWGRTPDKDLINPIHRKDPHKLASLLPRKVVSS